MSHVSEENKSEQESLSSNQTELILQSLSEGICRINVQGNITFVNASATRMLGVDNSSEIIGKHYGKVFFNKTELEDSEDVFDPVQFALDTGETSHVNTETFYKQDGRQFLVEYICVPIKEGEEIIGAVISFDDVTERRDIEIALTNARDKALEATQAKTSFLANMSHEIRTPLNGIIGTTSLLLDTPLNDEQKNYIKMLRTSTDLLLHIVNDILDFSKIEAGKYQIEEVEFDIYELIQEVINVFLPIVKEREIKLDFEIQESIPQILQGDSNKIKQILNNFLSNAIKFTDRGRVLLRVEEQEKQNSEIELHFSIQDSGIGIDEETQQRLFQPFTQADVSTTRRFGGTGLGLAICRNLVDMMEGKIGVNSVPNEGSTFWFTANFVEVSTGKTQDISQVSISSDKNVGKRAIKKSDLKILIVEDNPINQQVTQKILEQIGLKAESVGNGLEALETCGEKDFHLVLMDCQMPVMDGFEATEKIRHQNKNLQDQKIIALTASATVEERKRCFEVGMDDYLSKPFTKNDLANIIEKYFDFQSDDLNLDLETNIIQHSLKNIIAPEVLQNFLEIEANGQEGFISEILNVFLDHSEEKFAELREAFSQKDKEQIKQLAHNLKGSSANTGLSNLSNGFAELEDKLKTEDWNTIGKQIEEISTDLTKIKNIVLEKN